MKRIVFLSGFLVLLLFSAFVVSDGLSAIDGNKAVTLAIVDSIDTKMSKYNKLVIDFGDKIYYLYAYDIAKDRKHASFKLTSEPNTGLAYIEHYFRLDISSQHRYHDETLKQYHIMVGKSKTIFIGNNEKLYIELLSIKNRKANLFIERIFE